MARRLLVGCLAGGILLIQLVVSLKKSPGYLRDSESGQSSISTGVLDYAETAAATDTHVLEDAFYALAVLQNSYFDAANGTWSSSIDWTGAVIETIVSGILTTMTQSLASNDFGGYSRWNTKRKENLISSVYAQVVHSFFGQNALAIKDQVSHLHIHKDGTKLTLPRHTMTSCGWSWAGSRPPSLCNSIPSCIT